MSLGRWAILCGVIFVSAFDWWFACRYAPVRFPNTHVNFDLGNWLTGLFIGYVLYVVLLTLALAWREFGKD